MGGSDDVPLVGAAAGALAPVARSHLAGPWREAHQQGLVGGVRGALHATIGPVRRF